VTTFGKILNISDSENAIVEVNGMVGFVWRGMNRTCSAGMRLVNNCCGIYWLRDFNRFGLL
jgi:hypothetical protein